VRSSGLWKASSGVSAGLNIAATANRCRPISVDGGKPRLRVVRDGGRERRPVRSACSGLRNARGSLCLLADGRERRELRSAAPLSESRAAPEVALKEPAIA
jgi:hypothetical protein